MCLVDTPTTILAKSTKFLLGKISSLNHVERGKLRCKNFTHVLAYTSTS
jgi:hypothetical protein